MLAWHPSLAALGALAALAAGCSDALPAPGPAAELDACLLLPMEEADPGGRHGLQPVRGEIDAARGRDFAKCTYATDELPPQVVALEVRRYRDAARARTAQREAARFLPTAAAARGDAVAGLGEEAVWAGGRLGQLHARAGALRLIVTVQVGPEGERAATARRLARRALDRLAPPAPPA